MSRLNVVSSGLPRHPSEITGQFNTESFKGLKVTFINMPLRESAAPNVPPEGPGILSSICRMYGADPAILDLNAYRIQEDGSVGLSNGRYLTLNEAEDLIVKHFNLTGTPDVVAFSGIITTLKWQEDIAKIIKTTLGFKTNKVERINKKTISSFFRSNNGFMNWLDQAPE